MGRSTKPAACALPGTRRRSQRQTGPAKLRPIVSYREDSGLQACAGRPTSAAKNGTIPAQSGHCTSTARRPRTRSLRAQEQPPVAGGLSVCPALRGRANAETGT